MTRGVAWEDGAAPDVLRLVTHAPSSDVLDLYTSVPWERLCGEVAKLRVERRKGAEVLALHSEACCNGLLHPEEEASKIKGLNGGGAGNRIRQRIRQAVAKTPRYRAVGDDNATGHERVEAS